MAAMTGGRGAADPRAGGGMAETEADAVAVVRRLQDATNAHDIDAMVACFAPDYRNETPVHPARSFTGRE
jgi:SnoaL-like domain